MSPGPALPVIGIYELCLAAATAVVLLAGGDPERQEAAREAVRQTFRRISRRPQGCPERGTIFISCLGPVEARERCPVCSILTNPTPGVVPPYVSANRRPLDHETLPPLNSYDRTRMRVLGATVWRRPDGTYIHRDTLHIGRASELETYSSRGSHTGATCPHCGAPRGPADPRYRLPL